MDIRLIERHLFQRLVQLEAETRDGLKEEDYAEVTSFISSEVRLLERESISQNSCGQIDGSKSSTVLGVGSEQLRLEIYVRCLASSNVLRDTYADCVACSNDRTSALQLLERLGAQSDVSEVLLP